MQGLSSSATGKGVFGSAPTFGVYGDATTANASGGIGVYGKANNSSQGIGVVGVSAQYQGVSGRTSGSTGIGVHGYASSNSGINYGVWGESASTSGYGVYSEGNAHVNGTFTATTKSFVIDHPLDPSNKYLYHSVVESSEMMNMYNGNTVLDENGQAIILLPAWFEKLNGDYRYQLTPVGSWAPLYIAERIKDSRFKIAGGEPGMEVSWQVTGVRRDPFAQQNRMQVEVTKPEGEQGTYLHPEVYGQPEEKRRSHKPPQTLVN